MGYRYRADYVGAAGALAGWLAFQLRGRLDWMLDEGSYCFAPRCRLAPAAADLFATTASAAAAAFVAPAAMVAAGAAAVGTVSAASVGTARAGLAATQLGDRGLQGRPRERQRPTFTAALA